MEKEKLEVSRKNVLDTYLKANAEERKVLEKVFGKENFHIQSDWMKVWNKFCKENNLKVKLPHDNPKDSDEEWDNSCVMLRHIFKIKRGKWIPDFTNGNQAKWFPYFKVSSSGLVFEDSYPSYYHTYSTVGSRLCLPTEKMSCDVAREYLPIFEKFHINL